MKITSVITFLTALICIPAHALIYSYKIRTSQNKIRMEAEHSCKKETIFFDFNNIESWKKQIARKQPAFIDEFNRLITSLEKYKITGLKKYNPSLFKYTDTGMVSAYKNLQEINTILKKINASIIIEEKYPFSVQLKNIFSDPMIYLPQFIGGAAALYHASKQEPSNNQSFMQKYVLPKSNYINYPLTFVGGTCSTFIKHPKSILFLTALIAYARHK